MKLIMTKGLPASGKTTWAKAYAKENGAARVNKDDLRTMLHDGRHSRGNEKVVVRARDRLVTGLLEYGLDVIVDDTNLHPKHEATLREIARAFNAEFVVQDFTDVPLKDCIARDLKRHPSVGSKVIRRMAAQFLTTVQKYEPTASGPPVVIVDIDGTLAHMNGRGPYEQGKYHTDLLDERIADLVRTLDRCGHEIVIMSGRDGAARVDTERWLAFHNVPYSRLYMRAAGDRRDDAIVKEELFDEYVRGRDVRFVLDDRDRVVDMWRRIGLTCLQVAEGDF